jgi:hypothetical protein
LWGINQQRGSDRRDYSDAKDSAAIATGRGFSFLRLKILAAVLVKLSPSTLSVFVLDQQGLRSWH